MELYVDSEKQNELYEEISKCKHCVSITAYKNNSRPIYCSKFHDKYYPTPVDILTCLLCEDYKIKP